MRKKAIGSGAVSTRNSSGTTGTSGSTTSSNRGFRENGEPRPNGSKKLKGSKGERERGGAGSVPSGTTSTAIGSLFTRRPPTSTLAGPSVNFPAREPEMVQVAEIPVFCTMEPPDIVTCVCDPMLGPLTRKPGGTGSSGLDGASPDDDIAVI